MDLRELLDKPGITAESVQKHLESLSGAERVRQATHLKRKQLAILWRLAEKSEPVKETDLVAADRKALDPIPFEGQNSLPAFRMFQKVFYRTHDGKIAGYNRQSMGWFTGPGYYIVKSGSRGVYIDYTEIPSEKPEGWPAIQRNEAGFSRFIYGYMQDYLRRVYGNILIGRATRHGKETENYFVLARP